MPAAKRPCKTTRNSGRPKTAVPPQIDKKMIKPEMPGFVVRDVLIERRVRQADLARAMGVSPERVNYILHGKNRINAEIALRLGKATSTDPAYWLQLQGTYDLFVASEKFAKTLDALPPLRRRGRLSGEAKI